MHAALMIKDDAVRALAGGPPRVFFWSAFLRPRRASARYDCIFVLVGLCCSLSDVNGKRERASLRGGERAMQLAPSPPPRASPSHMLHV